MRERNREPEPMALPLPLGGIARDVSPAMQPPGTSRELLNVRTVAGSTGEIALSSRGGLVRMTEAPVRSAGEPVRSVHPFDWPQEDYRYRRLPVPRRRLELLERETVLDVTVDGQGGLVCLLASGGVQIVNPDGVVVGRIAPPTPVGFEPVRRVVVDLEGGVWIGATRSGQTEGGSGRLWRFTRQPNDEWAQFSEMALVGGILDFDVRFADIAILTLGVDDEEGLRFLARAGSAFAALPQVFDEREVPSLSHIVRLAEDRGAIVAAPPDPERIEDAGTFTERSVSWTPREALAWQTRVHAWLSGADPQLAGVPLVAATELTDIDDERFRETQVGQTADTLRRPLVRDPRGVRTGPSWNPEAFGGRGGASFGTGTQLVTARASSDTDPTLNPTLIPQGERWALFMVVQPVLSPAGQWRTGQILTQAWAPSGSPLVGLEIVANTTGIDIYDPTGLRATWNAFSSEAAILISIVFEGAAAATSRLRINGEHIANVTFAVEGTGTGWTEVTGVDIPGPRTIIGNPSEPEPPNLLLRSGTTFSAIGGGILLEAELLRDGVTTQQSDNPTLRPEGSSLVVSFGGVQRVSSLKFWQRSETRRAERIRIRAADNAAITTNVVDLGEFQVGQNRTFMDIALPQTLSKQHWAIDYLEAAPGSGNIWEIQELELYDRVQVQLTQEVGATFELGTLLVLTEPGNPGAVNGTGAVGALPADVTDVEAIEGYLAHDFGIGHLLPVDHPYTGPSNPPLGAGELVSTYLDRGRLRTTSGLTAKFRPNGVLSWAEAGPGHGYGVGLGPDGEVWTLGSREAVDGVSAPWLRRFFDLGGATRTTGDGVVAVAGLEALEPALRPSRLAVDGAGLVHIPIVRPRTRESLVETRDTAGTLLAEYRPACSSAVVAVASGPELVEPSDLAPRGAEYLAVALAGVACGLHRVDLLEREAVVVDGPRGIGLLAISDGEVVAYNVRTGQQLLVGAGSQFDRSRRARGVQAFGRMFLSDGQGVRVFDPLRRSIAPLVGQFHGETPAGFGECELHGGRLFLARTPKAPNVLFASARGEPLDFDIAPPVPLRGQAFTLTGLDRVGTLPFPPTGIASLSDDLLLVWTTRSMHVLAGDPTEGGGLDTVSPEIGMPYGAPWCRSPDAEAYWLDDYGLPWRYRAGAPPERIGVGRVDETLRRVDMRTTEPTLVWSRQDDGLHILLTPRGRRTESRRHLFWCRRTDAWTEDSFRAPGHEPLCGATLRGDRPEERVVVLGCADGHIRAWSRAADEDDGEPIHYDALLGPFGVPVPGEVLFSDLSVDLAKKGGPVSVGVHASDEADAAGVIAPRVVFQPGANGAYNERWAGRFLWVRCRGNASRQWVLRELAVSWTAKGRRRFR